MHFLLYPTGSGKGYVVTGCAVLTAIGEGEGHGGRACGDCYVKVNVPFFCILTRFPRIVNTKNSV